MKDTIHLSIYVYANNLNSTQALNNNNSTYNKSVALAYI